MTRSRPEFEVYLDKLRSLPFVRAAELRDPPKGEDRGLDAMLAIKTKMGLKKLAVQLRRTHIARETAESILHQAKRIPKLLVLAPVVGREIGRLFEMGKVNFLDRAGNCFLNLDDQYVARIQGESVPATQRTDKGIRAAGYRVLFALLTDRGLVGATTRAVAKEAGGVSPQTVNDIRHRLVERGLMVCVGDRHQWTPGKESEVQDLWLTGFATTLWPRLLHGRFRSRVQDPATLEPELAKGLDLIGEWRWGGGAAAMRLTRYYRGERTLVYLRDEPPADLAKRLRLIRDERGNLLIARAPGPLAFSGPADDTVHPLLIYADLLAEGNDRATEAAEVLRDKMLLLPENVR